MNTKSLLPVLIAPLFPLLIPLVAMQVSDEWTWTVSDFTVAWALMAGVGLAYKFVTQKAGGSTAYRLASGVALAAGFMIVWGNLAVGFIGSGDNPANAMYFGVLFIGLIGAGLTRFSPVGMTYMMLVTAFALFLVPVIAYFVRRADFAPGVARIFALNFVFVLMFIASALLFRHAALHPSGNRTAANA